MFFKPKTTLKANNKNVSEDRYQVFIGLKNTKLNDNLIAFFV